jgi:hypothetical protein
VNISFPQNPIYFLIFKQNNNGSSSAIIYRDQLGSVSATSSAINSNSNANGGIGNNNTKEVVELIPQVAMLMRGERIPTVPTEMVKLIGIKDTLINNEFSHSLQSPRIKSKDKKIRGLSDYREQIQVWFQERHKASMKKFIL